MFPRSWRSGLLPALVLYAAPALAQGDLQAACLDRSIGLAAQVEACTTALAAAATDADRAAILAERARALRLSGDLEAARADAEESMRLAPQDADPLVDLAYIQRDTGDPDAATSTLERAVALEPGYFRPVVALMDLLPDVGRLAECLDLRPQAEQLAPDLAYMWAVRGRCELDGGLAEEALASLEKAVSIGLEEAFVYNNLSIALYGLDRVVESLRAAKHALKIDPLYEGAHYSVIDALFAMDRPDDAVQAYRDALSEGVEDTLGLANDVAWKLHLIGRDAEALPIIEDWLAAHPNPGPEAIWELDTHAHVLAGLGRAEEAAAEFERAAKLGGPEFQAAYEARLEAQGFSLANGLREALLACARTGSACRLSD